MTGNDGMIRTNLSPESFNSTLEEANDFYVLKRIVKVLGGGSSGNGDKGYFFSRILVLFWSEALNDPTVDIDKDETTSKIIQSFLDYKKMRVIVLLPDLVKPEGQSNEEFLVEKEEIRGSFNYQYTMGAEDMKSRGAMMLMRSMGKELKVAFVNAEKGEGQNENS